MKRNERIAVRVAREEGRAIRRAARFAGKTVSDYIRERALPPTEGHDHDAGSSGNSRKV